METATVPYDLRATLRREMIAGGIPPHHVDEALDLGCHATEQAVGQINAIINRASAWGVKLASFSIAASLVSESLQNTLGTLKAETLSKGGIVIDTQVEGQAHG